MKKKKILHFHPNKVMAAIFVLPLLRLEQSEGYESKIITSSNSLKDFKSEEFPFDISFKNLFLLPFAFIKLCNYLAKYRPDMVICHNSKSSPLPLLCAFLMRIPVRIYFNHGIPYVGYRGPLKFLLRSIEVFNMHLSTKVITVSLDMQAILSKINNKKEVSLIASGSACGLDLSKYRTDQQNYYSFYDRHQLSESNIIVTFVGRPEVRKGIIVVLNLWEKYFQHKKLFKLFLCGPTEKDVIQKFGYVPDGVDCLGFVNDVPEILSHTNYLILPSFHEGLSYAVLEALACGCIVFANDIAGINNLIKDGINGFIIKNNLIEDYADKIFSIERSPLIIRERLKKNAISSAQPYSREIFLKAYKEYLSRVI
ncbi:glycosyltransferase family 4 protein [Polynucleobacter paneuropaeus]|nr:glycosyltransferase family 4 protein [Polynucleobacter paneuropaeus]